MSADPSRASFKSQQQQQQLANTRLLNQLIVDQATGSQQANQLGAPSNPMIVNSQPYNPSQQSQQQRCIGLDQPSPPNLNAMATLSRQLANSLSTPSGSQQNSLYGSSFGQSQQQQQQHLNPHHVGTIQSHLFDSATNHHHLQQSIFDSTCDISLSSSAQQQRDNNSRRLQQQQQQLEDSQLKQASQNNEVSFYSPSSSTSLLYHIYDQINLPNEQQQQQHFHNPQSIEAQSANQQQQQQQTSSAGPIKKSNTTTILNPANLFSQHQQQASNQLSLAMQLNSSQQVSQDLHKTLGQQQHYLPQTTNGQFHTLGQPQPNNFGPTTTTTLHHQQASYLASAMGHPHPLPHNIHLQQQHPSQLPQLTMLDTMMRHHHHQQQNASSRHNLATSSSSYSRPLSSSGASSMSSGGQSGQPIAYGRQPRQPLGGLNKSQGNLASVLQAGGAAMNLNLTSVTGAANSIQSKSVGGPPMVMRPFFGSTGRWRQVNKRARNLLYEYRTIVKTSIILILLAFTLIKLTLLSASTSSTQQQQQIPLLLANNPASSHQIPGSNTLIYPPYTKQLDQNEAGNVAFPPPPAFGIQAEDEQTQLEQYNRNTVTNQQQQQQDSLLKSKLVIGQFVIISQNYSQSPTQKSTLAERIVKLMDQVFLATDVRNVYSRMEVTNIRPNRPSGIIIDCQIILSESIASAAQQFGVALVESLVKSHERLANLDNYIIDRNSIKFNTVTDKDLKSGIVPAGLIPATVSRELALNQQQQDPVAPPRGRPTELVPIETGLPNPVGSDAISAAENQMNQVVWSEWSGWSSCVDKNGNCDETRIHSRLRKCVSQHTGEKVDANQCRQRFNLHDLELEVADCSRTCKQQEHQQQPDSHIMSDAPSLIGPQTAPSVLVGGGSEPSFINLGANNNNNNNKPKMSAFTKEHGSSDRPNLLLDLYTQPASIQQASGSPPNSAPSQSGGGVVASSSPNPFGNLGGSTTERMQAPASMVSDIILSSSLATPTMVPPTIDLTNSNSQMSCSNCTSDEICLLLMQQKVPFCAKVKDRTDESGCGGWCKAQNQLCQPVGQNAFKCIHDSECLVEEWRCHDSACIPLSKRCDGHSNCYDSSDERDCPMN